MAETILLVEDTPSLQMMYETILSKAGFEVDCANSAAEGASLFERGRHRIVLLDLLLPDRDGLELMSELLQSQPNVKVIVITANGSINRAVSAMRAGAFDFLVKPFDDQRLLVAVDNAIRDFKGQPQENIPAGVTGLSFQGFIGSSPVMQEVYNKISSISRSMATVFITGESGTGKEVCADAIHNLSNRSSGPFVPLNCGAIPADLLESEVFGHLKGSFTGAISDKIGAAAAAQGGTLFLDEICEMDMALQTKLLRFLQTSTIQPVGAVTARKVDVRIICATNRDPALEVAAGRFREDLFYRLHVVPIHLPPLKGRGDDAVQIAQSAVERFAQEERKAFTALSAGVKDVFRAHPWPGNVRQVLNVVRNAVVLNEGREIKKEMLARDFLAGVAIAPCGDGERVDNSAPDELASTADAAIGRLLREKMTLAELEKALIEATIARYGGSVPKAARHLDVSPSTLYRKRENWLADAETQENPGWNDLE